MKTAIINQPAGLGDILFCLKIGIELSKTYDEVLWPVIEQYSWLPDYLELPENLRMITFSEPQFNFWTSKDKNFHKFDLNNASSYTKSKMIMDSKYDLVKMDFSNWREYVKIKRNREKEEGLLLELAKSMMNNYNTYTKRYNLINEYFASPPNIQSILIPNPNNLLYNAILFQSNFWTPFDWMGVIEKASSLHFVDTSFSFIIEFCHLQTDDLHLYSRFPGKQTWKQTQHLFKTKWNYV